MKIREEILEDLIELELFNTYCVVNDEKVYTYEIEGYDKEKIESEGSIWIVYTYDCMNDYYSRNKDYFDEWVNEVLYSEIVR